MDTRVNPESSLPDVGLTRRRLNSGVALVLSIFGWLLFGVGLLSPLTPSQGNPRWYEVVIFLGVPVLTLLAIIIFGAPRWVRVAAVVETILLVCIALFVVPAI